MAGTQFNHRQLDSNKAPQLSTFTTRHSHALTAPSARGRQSHTPASDNGGPYHSQTPHNGQAQGQSGADSVSRQMPEYSNSPFAVTAAGLNGTLLCSAWPSLPAISSALPAPTAQQCLPPTSLPMDHQGYYPFQIYEFDLPPLEQVVSASSASHSDPTPALTPISSTGSTPATSIDLDEDRLPQSPPKASIYSLDKYRTIQPKPPEGMTALAETAPAELATHDPSRYLNSAGIFPTLEELPEWPQSAGLEFSNSGCHPLSQSSAFDIPLTETSGSNTIDPFQLNVFDEFVDPGTLDTFEDGTLGAYPDLPNEFDHFDGTTGDGSASHVGLSMDPYMPSMAFGNTTHGGGTDERPYTGNLGADDAFMPLLDYEQAPPFDTGTLQGEGSRRDTTRDDELMDLRAKGFSYRDIKQKFGFTEAESTLRGRMRSLTKRKEDRVRKPIWKTDNVSSSRFMPNSD